MVFAGCLEFACPVSQLADHLANLLLEVVGETVQGLAAFVG